MAAKAINLHEAWSKWKRRVRIDLVHQLPLRGTPKVILGKINDKIGFNEWCWPSVDWLAKEAGCCERTVQNILAQLKKLNLIETEERYEPKTGRQQSNFLRIVWPTIGRMTKTKPLSVLARPARLSTSKPLPKILATSSVAPGGCKPCGGRVQPVAGGGCNLAAPLEFNRRAIGNPIESHSPGNGDFQSDFNGSGSPAVAVRLAQTPTPREGEAPAEPSGRPRIERGSAGASPSRKRSASGGWPAPLTLDGLKDRFLLTLNFHHARRQGWVREDDEARFKTLAASIVDRYEHPPPGRRRIQDVGATFTNCVKRKLWFGAAKHEETAIGKPKREASYSP